MNVNCLEGWKCPKCGHEDSFRVVGTIVATLTDDGTDRDDSDFEFEGDSPATCDACDYSGVVNDFLTDKPDDVLRNMFEQLIATWKPVAGLFDTTYSPSRRYPTAAAIAAAREVVDAIGEYPRVCVGDRDGGIYMKFQRFSVDVSAVKDLDMDTAYGWGDG